MKTYMQRGKVDVFITYEDYTFKRGALKYNKELAGEISCIYPSDGRGIWP